MCRQRPLGVARAALLLIAVLALVPSAGCGRLDEDAVSTELRTLQSSTAEGMLVAEQAARSRAPTDFIEIRTAELSKQSRNSADALVGTPTEPGLQEAAERGSAIGRRASELLDSLHSEPGNSGLATQVTSELKDLSDEASRVEASL